MHGVGGARGVLAGADGAERPDFLVIKKNWPKTEFSVNSDDAKLVTLKTAKLKIEVTSADSTIVFLMRTGRGWPRKLRTH